MEYKVVKEFGCAQKGDILQGNDEGFFELSFTCDCDDCYCSRNICISADVADTLLSAGFLEEIEEDIEMTSNNKVEKVIKEIDAMIDQYTADHEALISEYNEGSLPQCVKVEADTVYFNLNKVLNKIKDLLNE